MSNTGAKSPVGELQSFPLEELFAAYDSLSPRMKELYDSMPENMNPMEFHAMVEKFGEEQAHGLITNFINANFPGWNGGLRRRK